MPPEKTQDGALPVSEAPADDVRTGGVQFHEGKAPGVLASQNSYVDEGQCKKAFEKDEFTIFNNPVMKI